VTACHPATVYSRVAPVTRPCVVLTPFGFVKYNIAPRPGAGRVDRARTALLLRAGGVRQPLGSHVRSGGETSPVTLAVGALRRQLRMRGSSVPGNPRLCGARAPLP